MMRTLIWKKNMCFQNVFVICIQSNSFMKTVFNMMEIIIYLYSILLMHIMVKAQRMQHKDNGQGVSLIYK